MINVLLIILVILVVWLTFELRDVSMKLYFERMDRKELEHDLKRLIELSKNTGKLPVTQPELLRPESVELSFNIIRLICICAENITKKENGK